MHYRRWSVHGDPHFVKQRKGLPPMRLCEVKGCERVHFAKGRCHTHYVHWRECGSDRYEKPRWSERESDELLALPRYRRSDKTVHGEQIHLGMMIGRTPAACSGRLSILRRAGEAGQ